MELELPDLVRRRAEAAGAAGRRWLDGLPEVVSTLADRWSLDLGPAYPGGTAAYVVAATAADGRALVLKVAAALDDGERAAFSRSVRAHRLAAGRGCAAVVDVDDAVPAMTLERLGPNLDVLGLPVPELLEVVAATLRTFWRPLDTDCGLPTGPQRAARLADGIVADWDELGRPCPRAVIDRALDCCAARTAAFDPASAVLIHGDAHGWNTLTAPEGGHKFVDPEGVRGEPAQDLGVPMREYNGPLLAGPTSLLVRRRAELLAESCGVDAEAVWQWGLIERVSTGLANVRDFGPTIGAPFLEVAARSR